MTIPDEGRTLQISERSLRALYDAVLLFDIIGLLGNCRESNEPYCQICWALQEAQEALQ